MLPHAGIETIDRAPDEAAPPLARATAVGVPMVAAYAYGAVVAAVMGWFLFGIPVQFSDSFGNLAQLDTTWTNLLLTQFHSKAYLRPFLWADLKLVYDLSGGDYYHWFRGVHALQVLALVVLYLKLVRPTTWRDTMVVPLGCAVLIGGHTFQGAVVEAFPVNTFLTVVLCCVAAAVLALEEHRWWTDVIAVLLFVVAALTVESGLLVWVVIVSSALAGARGVSRFAAGVSTVLFAGYFVLRFLVLDVGAPALIERSSGFGFRSLDPGELVARFGSNPIAFYAYNVMSSLLSVLMAEPRSGVFRLTHGVVTGTPSTAALITTAGALLGTVLIAAYAWQRRHEWFARRFDRDDQIVVIFLAVLVANAVIAYPYTKDVVMSPAGAFYAAAVYVAVRRIVVGPLFGTHIGRATLAAAVAATLAVCWGIRDVGIHMNLRVASFKVRNEWAFVDDDLPNGSHALQPWQERLLRDLQRDAVDARPAPPQLSLGDLPVFEID